MRALLLLVAFIARTPRSVAAFVRGVRLWLRPWCDACQLGSGVIPHSEACTRNVAIRYDGGDRYEFGRRHRVGDAPPVVTRTPKKKRDLASLVSIARAAARKRS